MALISNIKKTYHSVETTLVEQHRHHFLWRGIMNYRKEPDTYVTYRVSLGDGPWGTVAIVALRKTVEMAQEKYPQEAKVINDNTCMDDIIESVGDRKRAESITQNIDKLVDIGGFKIEGSDSQNEKKEIPSETHAPPEKVLEVCWRHIEDQFCFKVTLNFSGRKRNLHTEPDIESHQLTESDSLPDHQYL